MPLLARIYPNGNADVNQFQAAGGPGFVIRELLDAGLLHADVRHVSGERAVAATAQRAARCDGETSSGEPAAQTAATTTIVLRRPAEPFSATGGLKLLQRQPRPRGDQGLGGEPEHGTSSRRRR